MKIYLHEKLVVNFKRKEQWKEGNLKKMNKFFVFFFFKFFLKFWKTKWEGKKSGIVYKGERRSEKNEYL